MFGLSQSYASAGALSRFRGSPRVAGTAKLCAMSLFRNRHIVIAMVVAPVLAIGAWFGVDYLFGERPQAAMPGHSYPLLETPGCRYAGGDCGLKNADFELAIDFAPGPAQGIRLEVESAVPLDGVVAALVSPDGAEQDPRPLRPVGPGARSWTMALRGARPGHDRLRIVASAGGAQYFGEVVTRFAEAKPDTE